MNDRDSSWPDDVDAGDRVRHVALTRTTPKNAGWIADEANVSRDTAVKYLSRLVEQGELETVETSDGTCYKPDSVTQFLRTVRQLAEDHALDELTKELDAIGDEIETWKAEYGVESLVDLRQSIGDEDLSAEERQRRLAVVDDWEYDVETREAIRLALDLKQSLTTLRVDELTDAFSTRITDRIRDRS